MRIVGAILDKVFGLPFVDTGASLFAIRRAETGDRDQVLRLAGGVRHPEAAKFVAAAADLNGTRCDCGAVIHCWVAADRLGKIVGVLFAIGHGTRISLSDLIVDAAWRNCGIGSALLFTLAEFADARRVTIAALVRGSDVHGLSWLCNRDFQPAQFADGRVAIVPDAFPGESCTEGIVLARPWPDGAVVRIAS